MRDGHIFYSFNEAASHLKKGWFFISYRGVLYPVWWDIDKPSDDYVVFIPGRTRREKPLPSFQRRSYSDSLDAKVICLCDPTLFSARDLGIGWFVGDKNSHYATGIGNLLKVYFEQFPQVRPLLYGSSAAGIPAFHIANIIGSSCTLYLNNVQTDARRYFSKHYKYMISCSFKGISIPSFEEKYTNRISICGEIRNFKIYMTQNISDEFHYTNHFLPFVESDKISGVAEGIYIVYNDLASGHDVMPREIELKVINNLLNRESIENIFPEQRYYKCEGFLEANIV